MSGHCLVTPAIKHAPKRSSSTLAFSSKPGHASGMFITVLKKLLPHLGMCNQCMGEAFILRTWGVSISRCRCSKSTCSISAATSSSARKMAQSQDMKKHEQKPVRRGFPNRIGCYLSQDMKCQGLNNGEASLCVLADPPDRSVFYGMSKTTACKQINWQSITESYQQNKFHYVSFAPPQSLLSQTYI